MFGVSSAITLVKGYHKSLLIHLQNGDIFHHENIDFQEVFAIVKKRFFRREEVSTPLFHFLQENRMIYKIPAETTGLFPPRKIEYHSKHLIEYIVHDYHSKIMLQKVIEICSFLKTPNLILILETDITDYLDTLLQHTSYPESISITSTKEQLYRKKNTFRLLFSKKDDRPFVHRDAMEFNLTLFSESHFYHTYFHKKLCITKQGVLKNTPESKASFGTINNDFYLDTVSKAITNKNFTKFWTVHKDKCRICKHCEFRYMCVDNRIPKPDKNDNWYHEIPCTYNPFIGKWHHEEGYYPAKNVPFKAPKNIRS